MKVALLASLGVASASFMSEQELQGAFLKFMKEHKKQYEPKEMFSKLAVFSKNLQTIHEHNAKGESFKMAVNEFADLTADEFSQLFKGYKPRAKQTFQTKQMHDSSKVAVADSVDWREQGAVTPVKDQGQCGSCWAFSTTGSVESANFLSNGQLVSLSEQQLVDCAGANGNLGCNGGLMDDAFEYIIGNQGIGLESDYSYTGRDGTCKAVRSAVTISGYKDVKESDESDLLSAVNITPVSIAVDAGLNWQLYGNGVMKGCHGKSLDHGVLVVGYGTDNGDDYWIIKNSWGASWGERGYIRVLRDMDACGLADAASYPIV